MLKLVIEKGGRLKSDYCRCFGIENESIKKIIRGNERMESLYGTIIAIAILVMISLAIITISKWKIYLKAHEPGWAAIIPFYGDYVLSNVVFGNSVYFKIIIACNFLELFAHFTDIKIFRIVGALISIFMYIKCSINLAYSFGKGKKFILGLIFLPFIFYPILAYGNSKYVFPKMRYII